MRPPGRSAAPGSGASRVAAVPPGRSPDRRPPPGRPGPGFAVRARFLPDGCLPGVTVAPGAPAVAARAAAQGAARRLARTGRSHVGGRLAVQVLGTPAGPAALARAAERAGVHAVSTAFPRTPATGTATASATGPVTPPATGPAATPITSPTAAPTTSPDIRRKSR
ncbi:hypothetical protein [Streptomyces sp. NPDC054887]